MANTQTAPEGFNNADWKLFPGNKNHVHFLDKCTELFWLIWECQHLTGEAFFGQEWLAERLGITVRHVQNLIAELKLAGLIEIDRRDQNYYRVVEFFSKAPGEWTEIARQKAKAALAKLFPNLANKTNSQKQSSRPRKESSFKSAKQSTTQQTPGQAPVSTQAVSKEEIEELQRAMARYEAESKAEQEIDPSLQAEVKKVADQLAKANYNKPKPSLKDFTEWLTIKLKSYGVEAPTFLVKKQALGSLQEYGYLFR